MSGMFGSRELSGARGNGLSKSEFGGRWESLRSCLHTAKPSCSPSDTLLAGSLQETGCSSPAASSRARNYLGHWTESLPAGECQSVLLRGPRQRRLVLGSKRKPGFLSAGSPASESPPACPGKMGLLGKTGALAESTWRKSTFVSVCGHGGVPGLNFHQQWCKSNLYHLK